MFSFISVILATSFLKADALSKQSEQRVKAMEIATTFAEHIRSLEVLQVQPKTWYYDKNWEFTDREKGIFRANLTYEEINYKKGSLYHFELEISKVIKSDKQLLERLDFSHYIKNERQVKE